MIEKKKEEQNLSNVFSFGIILFAVMYFLFSVMRSIEVDLSGLEVFNTVFTSILMQAFPFMLIGILVSSIMHFFVPDEWIVKIFPIKYGLGFLTAMFIGLFLPVCECAIIPVMNRLVRKGVPIPIAITFMLSAPIINPIVILSTLYAFPNHPQIMFMRVSLGLFIALIIGLVMARSSNSVSIFLDDCSNHSNTTKHDSVRCSCHNHDEERCNEKGMKGKIKNLFLHAGEEFFSVGKYLILGAFITSLIQMMIPRDVFVQLGAKRGIALIVMMSMAFLFSACSTSDAFIARSFLSRFSVGSIMGFLVFGPMMDMKNLLMLFANFRKSFVIKLSLLIVILNFLILNFLSILFF
ncbi:permease [Inediibacterium massiliense]|uniref:permease n=1 Tax=Inediibacterium massiliense TaxID=1658111 RepID=UPI0006B4E89B|nr:permease [Inediibacterium massiliense]